MAIESYEQIMARLNGQQTQTPKAATDFSTYVQNLLLNTNPQGGMMSDAEAYRADPFRRQNAINASLDEALKKKQAEEAAKAAASRGGMGMMGSGGGESGGGVPLTQEQIDFLDRETPEERYARITGDWFGLKPMGMMMLDPIGTFLTYPKQDPSNVIVETRTGKTPAQIAQEQLQSNLIAQDTRNRESAAIAQAEAAKAAAIQAAAAEAARAANPFGVGVYNESARTGDWSWFDNASSGQQDSMISNFERSDAAGNAAAAATGYYGAGDI